MLRWNRTVTHLRRYRHIMAVLMKYGFEEVVSGMRQRMVLRMGARSVPSRVRRDEAAGRSRPQRVRMALEELGPTFIKFGQLLSTRPDLLPADYIFELEHLQDHVAPESFEDIRAELERELGGPIGQFFSRFDRECIAAGSIAQVHRAVTRDGKMVAVKIRRPKIVQTIRTECEILETFAGLLKSAGTLPENLDPVRLVREFTDAVGEEADLGYELRNLRRFARAFEDDPTVHLPEAYEELCTPGVLTMEYIDGVKPRDGEELRRRGMDTHGIASNGARFILHQVFDVGLFHTDPHPGNLLILPDETIVPLDFGQVAHLASSERRLVGEIVLAVVDLDAEAMVRGMERHEMLGPQVDSTALTRDIEEMLGEYHGMPLKDIPFARVMRQVFDLIRTHRVRPPAEFTLMLKSLMTIESLATRLDPQFQIIEHLRPYAIRLRMRQYDPRRLWKQGRRALRDAMDMATHLPADLGGLLRRIKRGQFHLTVQHEHLENLVRTLDRSASRISFAVIIAALLVASSMLVGQEGAIFGIVRLQSLGILGYCVAAVMGIWLLVSIIRSRHL